MAEPKHEAGKIDWTKLKSEYATTGISYRGIAEKYGIGKTNVERHARQEKWREARKKYREKCAETAINKLARAEGNKLAKLAYSADKLLKRVTKAIEDPNQFNRYIVDGAEITDNGEVQKKIEVCFSKADTKAMLEMANTLKTLTAVIRNVNEISTNAEMEARQIALEKMQLERERRENAQGNNEVVIRFEGESIEKYSK